VDSHETHDLIIFNDDYHSYQHFASAIKTVFPSLSDKAIRCICALIHKSGSAVCMRGHIERLEMCQLMFEKFSIKCVVERRLV